MQYTIRELCEIRLRLKAEIKALTLTVLKYRAERLDMQQRIDQLTQDNAWLVASRKRHMDACALAEAGVETLTKTVAWLADNQRNF